MKLLYLTPTYNSYSEVWQQRHIEMLSEYISFIATVSPNENKWRDKIPVIDLNPERLLSTKIIKTIAKNTNNDLKINKHVQKLINQVDTVFIQYLTFAVKFVDIINSSNKPTFIHCHGFDVTWDFRSHENPNVPKHDENYVKRVLSFNKNVFFIANSKNTIQKLKKIGVKDSQIKLKYLGTEITNINPKNEPNKEVNILYLGRLVDFKGPDMVIESFNIACEKGIDSNLLIAGDGQLRVTCEIMKRKSKFADKIQILGAVNKLKADELRQSADIFIAQNCTGLLSKQEEAFGVSIIEAMANGIPVITGRSGGVQETVIHNETGLLNEPYNIEEQAKNIIYLCENLDIAKKMGEAGRKRVEELFSFDIEKENFLKILMGNK